MVEIYTEMSARNHAGHIGVQSIPFYINYKYISIETIDIAEGSGSYEGNTKVKPKCTGSEAVSEAPVSDASRWHLRTKREESRSE